MIDVISAFMITAHHVKPVEPGNATASRVPVKVASIAQVVSSRPELRIDSLIGSIDGDLDAQLIFRTAHSGQLQPKIVTVLHRFEPVGLKIGNHKLGLFLALCLRTKTRGHRHTQR
uniref:(northern house mosquito) hypothetical protein n=1 Tax=Culex pipiens TaxID=7175 RepID=A0A8D8NH19_CULPI